MATESTKSGIRVVGDLTWGTHFCLFYETQQDLLDILIPYFQAGLENRESCLWVISPPLTKEEAWSALQQAIPDLDRYRAVGSIEIVGRDGWYLNDGVFESRRVVNGWQEKLDQALTRGYVGMRVSGDTHWLLQKSRRDFGAYEKDLGEAIALQRLVVLCTFLLAASAAGDILNVLRIHDRAVVKRDGNWEVVETPELRQAKQELERLNKELEQRVVQRTGELVAANEELRREIAERKRAEAAEREQRTLAEALRDTAAALNSSLDFEEVVARILKDVGRVVPHDASVVLLLESNHWQVVGHKGFTERGIKKEWLEGVRTTLDEGPLYKWVVRTGQPMVVSDCQSNPEWVSTPQSDWIRSLISAPIRIKGRVIGLLNLYSHISNFFMEAQAAPLLAFAAQAATALENARLLHQVEIGRERLQALSEQLLVAQETERQEIARELHDQIGQVLTAVSANLMAIDSSSDSAELAERLEESLELIDEAINQVRDLSLDLRPSLLDDFGLVPALEWYIDRLAQRSGLQVEFIAQPPEMRVRNGIEIACFRVAQIVLTNVARHSQAKKIYVKLSKGHSWLEMVIRDDGVGFDVLAALERASRGVTLGLLSMQERVRLAHGKLDINSVPGQGTEIRVRFPLDK